MVLGFNGGVRTNHRSGFAHKEIKTIKSCSAVKISAGDDVNVVAESGQEVKRGTLLGVSDETPVYSSLEGVFSGLVEENGVKYFSVKGNGGWEEEALCPPEERNLTDMTREDIIEIAKKFGIIDSRSGTPLWKLLSFSEKFRRVVVDCTETDSLSAMNFRLCVEKASSVVGGAKVLMQATKALKCVFAAEYNRGDIFDALSEFAFDKKLFAMAPMEEKYPYGDRALMYALYLKYLRKGETALDRNVLIVGAETAFALYEAMVSGLPQLDRYVSFSGVDGKNGENLCVPKGISLEELTELAEAKKDDCLVVENSLLSGDAAEGYLKDDTHALICVIPREKKRSYCISCGKCALACPVLLFPFEVLSGRNKKLKETCISCGACQFICPSGIPLTELIQQGKKEILNCENVVEEEEFQ